MGTWIDCDASLFPVPTGEVGVQIRADYTWQKLGVSAAELVFLQQHEDYGTWSVSGEECSLQWDTSGLATFPMFSADGKSMFVSTTAGGNEAILAKATGTP